MGYNIYLTGNDKVIFKGNINGSVNPYSLSYTSTYSHQGWNLVGNPYPCNYDLTGVDVLNNSDDVDNTVYYTKDGVFYYWNVFTDAGIGVTSDIVPPMQGFFIKVRSEGNTFNLPTAFKTAGAGDVRSKGSAKSAGKKGADISKIKLVLGNGAKSDETIVCLIDDATNGFDGDYDAEKLFGGDNTQPFIHSALNNFRYAINAVKGPEATPVIIPLTVTIKTPGTYSISISEFENLEDVAVTLRHGSVDTKINYNTSYTFTSAAGTFNNFQLIFGDVSTGTEPQPEGSESFKTWYSNDYLYINSPVALSSYNARVLVMDLQGRVVHDNPNLPLIPGETVQEALSLSRGMYVVQVLVNQKVFASKIVVM